MITLDSPVAAVLGSPKEKAAGRTLTRITEGLGLRTVGDLLGHHPRRYLETGTLTELDTLQEGQLVTLVGEVSSCHLATYRDRRTGRTAYRVEVTVRADGASLKLSFFAKSQHTAQWQAKRMAVGRRGVFMGQVSLFRSEWQLTHPQLMLFGEDEEDADAKAGLSLDAIGALYPIYPLTKGLESWDLQRAVTFARTVLDELPELLPEVVRSEFRLLDARSALDQVHAPDSRGQVHAAQRRYRFEEALITQLVLARRRRFVRALGTFARDGSQDGRAGGLLSAFDARLPFELTGGQREIGAEIEADLARSHPMNRLLQGEVGSGKTLVALRAMLRVVDSGGQAALLAPTEVLAQQHHRSITALLGDLAGGGMLGGAPEATTVELLTGSMGKRERTAPLSRLALGEAGIAIGTHALLEDQVQFHDLGLVVVDEQHRFGVEQRSALTDKSLGSPPHVLVMTATPIPRTVAMTVFGDLEVSTLSELPAGRAPIQTTVVPLADQPAWLDRVWGRVREEVDKGHQVYVVCPRISADDLGPGQLHPSQIDPEEHERPPMASVEAVHADLTTHHLTGLRIEPLHGRMTPDEKDRTMRRFAAGEVDVLVSTTVIEVGVDVANATAMVVLDADRFGISQLHQLRGRVGRGGLPGLCLLVTTAAGDLPGARERLDALARTSDGFELSRVDLEQRREGDVLGRSQAGYQSTLQNLRVLRDEKTIVEARAAAESLLDQTAPGAEDLAAFPELHDAVWAMEASVQSAFMDKS